VLDTNPKTSKATLDDDKRSRTGVGGGGRGDHPFSKELIFGQTIVSNFVFSL
jgi:hypothetical protein